MNSYNPQEIERKWRKIWEENKTFQVDLKHAKNPYYNLMMFPYPSAEGLHVGNVYAFTGSDIYGRFRRMQGNDVFEPMGFDAFGIHSENFAIKKGIHPKILIKKNTDNFREQLKNLGCLFDWEHEVDTTRPEYYKWTQWLFLQLYKAGLAYRKKAPVDWCPSCKTVLADEQVISGQCERCDSEVIQKETEQWFFKITEYAEKLLKNLNTIDWSERTKITQKNWIGRSEGVNLKEKVKGLNIEFEVFDTVPQTFLAQTFTVIAPEHPLVKELVKNTKYEKPVMEFIEKIKRKRIEAPNEIEKDIEGIFIGRYIDNPFGTGDLPIWLASYVIAGYGTGIVNCSAHDERDFAFAKKYNIPLKLAMLPSDKELSEKVKNFETCYHHAPEGIIQEPIEMRGMTWEKARGPIIEHIEKKGFGKRGVNYHLRDWLISRQRYWGPPIPIIYCAKCGVVPVPEKDLPVLLPDVENFKPKDTGESPLALVSSFVKTKCPQCGGPARRETDVSDTFLDSSWYFFRYPSSDFKNKPFDENITKEWLPVDMYIGGQEHAVLHLLYTRFITMALKDSGFIDFEEPFKKFRAHGLLTKGGAKMSKSKGNVVNPDDYFKRFGADTLRMYLMFIGPFEAGGDWQDRGIIGISRFLEKVWALQRKPKTEIETPKIENLLHKTIKKVDQDLENLQYNTAISALMILVNALAEIPQLSVKTYKTLLLLLAPFAPHIAEELWRYLEPGSKQSIHDQKWPEYDSELIKEDTITLIVQVNGKVRDTLEVKAGISESEAKELTLSQKKVKNYILNKEIKKIIFIRNKLINIVV